VQHDLGAELQRLTDLHARRERAFDELQTAAGEARKAREAQRALGAGRRGQLDVLAERLNSLARERSRIERESAAAERALGEWSSESASLDGRRSDLVARMETAEGELQAALEQKASGEEDLRESADALELERQAIRDRESELAGARTDYDASRRRVEERRVELAGLEHDSGHLHGEFVEQLGEAPPELPGEAPANLAELEVDLARLKEQLEAIGPVNILAAEESASEEERHAFLTTQRTDIAKSVESLRGTIQEINKTSSARFKEAFDLVNAQFSKTFVDLFRGGEAEMRLMDEDDLLESGIEIVARPPGKRLQNLMLMSGGEKALTAIALLFALFRIKPSPFCILDEVDAPLDDVNTLRFVGMLRELAKETQCIVITHNKLTMEVAGTLYGVTMEERGVSKLVAVQLEEVQPAPAAATA
jgi:chromosome segregation protein